MTTGIVELDLHGCRTAQAKEKIDAALAAAHPSVYRLRLIHGYHGGTGIRRMVEEEYGYGREPKVLRVTPGTNPGITELVLREFA
ncbi:MAG: hypothetical protein Q4C60_03990 [Eubacteriales bacterium]|nr:hypothetical protein [Eubacteriales bacterium]